MPPRHRFSHRGELWYCEAVKNITVSVPEEVYHAARVKAAEQRTTISAIVREQLQSFANKSEPNQRGRRILETIERIQRERAAAGEPPFDPAENLTREELYDLAIRGHKRTDI